MTPIKIDKNIPMPEPRRGTGMAEVMRQMKIGDSVVLPEGMSQSSGYTYARYAEIRVTVRKQQDGRFRAWRINK